jgi:hypothetical protein
MPFEKATQLKAFISLPPSAIGSIKSLKRKKNIVMPETLGKLIRQCSVTEKDVKFAQQKIVKLKNFAGNMMENQIAELEKYLKQCQANTAALKIVSRLCSDQLHQVVTKKNLRIFRSMTFAKRMMINLSIVA